MITFIVNPTTIVIIFHFHIYFTLNLIVYWSWSIHMLVLICLWFMRDFIILQYTIFSLKLCWIFLFVGSFRMKFNSFSIKIIVLEVITMIIAVTIWLLFLILWWLYFFLISFWILFTINLLRYHRLAKILLRRFYSIMCINRLLPKWIILLLL